MTGISSRIQAAIERVFVPAGGIDLRFEHPGPIRWPVGDQEPRESLPPVVLLRAGDLLQITFRFYSLERVDDDHGQVLVRRQGVEQGHLVAEYAPQHLLEEAFFESAGPGVKAAKPIPQEDRTEPEDEVGPDPNHGSYPLEALAGGASRLVFRVTDERIRYSEVGLLHAMRVLALELAPHAGGGLILGGWRDYAEELGVLSGWAERLSIIQASAAERMRLRPRPRLGPYRERDGHPLAQGRVEPQTAMTRASAVDIAELARIARLERTATELELRFGPASAVTAVAANRVKPPVASAPITLAPQPPRRPRALETAIELPWRLQLSPAPSGSFAHALTPIEHLGRVELWHSRLVPRRQDRSDLDPRSAPELEKDPPGSETIRAIWTRDLEGGDEPLTELPKKRVNLPKPKDDRDPFLSALSARDRTQLVHLTSNHHWDRNYVPVPVPVENLMLTAAGGWLAARGLFDPPEGLSVSEWNHRTTMGRDQYVKVVYEGVLLPFGHLASLVKVTERRVKADKHAALYQRLFVVVREQERQFRVSGVPESDNGMPFTWLRILTRSTPPLAEPVPVGPQDNGQVFVPSVAVSDDGTGGDTARPFGFRMSATDVTGRIVEFEGPLVFVEKTALEPAFIITGRKEAMTRAAVNAVAAAANAAQEPFDLRGQRIAYAAPLEPDDTTLATRQMSFNAAYDPVDREHKVLPVLAEAQAVIPAMAAFTGQPYATRVVYPPLYLKHGVGSAENAGGIFLGLKSTTTMNFASQSDRSGGFVSPSVDITGLARRFGPVGGDLELFASGPGNVDVSGIFGSLANLFGVIPLDELLSGVKENVPTFVTEAVDAVVGLGQALADVEAFVTRLGSSLEAGVRQQAQDLGAKATELTALLTNKDVTREAVLSLIGDIASRADSLLGAAFGPSQPALPRPEAERLAALLGRLAALASDADHVVGQVLAFVNGAALPEEVNARLDWQTELPEWSPPGLSGAAVFRPRGDKTLRLISEIQAPLTKSGSPTALVSCSLPPFTLQLMGKLEFVALHIDVMEFSVAPGKKPDVNVVLRGGDGIEFLGPLAFVNRLKDVIPFDGFSDPPYLDVAPSGLTAGFDLAVPDLAMGVFALTNIHVGAELVVPFIGESLEFRFFFATRENPFRLQVAMFAGGGFFAMTLSPAGVRVIEAAFEFGAAAELNFIVAKGSVAVMAGIYFRLENSGGSQAVQLSGYFRARGEVDVLGLISACIEIYLELSYRSIDGRAKAVGKASISVEVSICFASFSVTVSCEKQFSGSSGDPTFAQTMGPEELDDGRQLFPWAHYCQAFAPEAV